MLYESYVHPITILSTLPSAGVGAVLALMLFDTEFSIIALIGVILLIGIVKKNAIMMIDFALEAERSEGLTPRDAIYQACLLRFRPIMMTTLAALLGALPLALGFGEGARTAPAARHRHRRRPDRQPGADALHDAGGLSLPRPLPAVGAAALAPRCSRLSPASAGARRMRRAVAPLGAAAAAAACRGCIVGPDYQRPDAPVPAAFKELHGWKPAQPRDAVDRGAWWAIYRRSGARRAGAAGRGLQPER